MERIDAVIQSYPWGSRTLIAELMGQSSPSARPQAEAWFGAHPLAPSTVGGRPLTEVIADDPAAALGPAAELADGTLPFLLKILAAAEPLSLQAHPTLEQAKAGFAAENDRGIPPTAPHRNYRDANHKPELIVALTRFHALAGFRPVERTKELFDELAIPELGHYTVMLDAPSPVEALRALFTTWLTLPSRVLGDLVEAVRAACAAYSGGGWVGEVAATTADIAARYPGDPGVLASMLLNRITLEPGEGIYLGAGQLHAYLSGMGVEIMANSDNVLRGGLTSKHVDVVELLRVLDFSPAEDPVVRPVVEGAVSTYPTAAPEFRLGRVSVPAGDSVEVPETGALIVLVVEGAAEMSSESGEVRLSPGGAAWVPADEAPRVLRSVGGSAVEAFVASVPV
ncbi:mannose-6-phosphate isomerase, class I [Corynebacterium hansenii]|uniref:mannose-6-phosphate isomerase n=1 Tax=Corynebacterium hansenii TaxID=394964 RepID=A0ABV7ZKF8_9CORY|nr:mannose-6-phosphate isomerase, class I [Corynebacterium hansenii]WJY99168.1 Mannose-6-phosphate isomerase [Corynebacterium hansenii]